MSVCLSRACAASFACLLALSAAAATIEDETSPDFSGFWQHGVPQQQYGNPPAGPGPVRRIGVPEDYQPNLNWRGNDKAPILQPWAAEAVRKEWERESQGLTELSPMSTCRPAGVPLALGYLRPMQILQAKDKIHILYQYDHQSRVIYLNQAHTKDLKPSYYGESVGHYEGDTLVVDTIGMNDKTWTDRFATPHTAQLHVIERYRVIDAGKTLHAHFFVTDPGAFTTSWSAVMTWPRMDVKKIDEEVCAENNLGIPIPVAEFDPITGEKFPGDVP